MGCEAAGCNYHRTGTDRLEQGELAAYKYPRIIEFRDELPKSGVGKILKRELVKDEAA